MTITKRDVLIDRLGGLAKGIPVGKFMIYHNHDDGMFWVYQTFDDEDAPHRAALLIKFSTSEDVADFLQMKGVKL